MTGFNAVLQLMISVCLWSEVQVLRLRKYIYHPVSLNWTEAVDFCRDQGETLAIVLDPAQNSEMAATFSTGDAWIGLNKGWVWARYSYSIPVSSGWSLPWAKGEPTKLECAVLLTDTKKFKTRDCNSTFQYVACEVWQTDKYIYTVMAGSFTWAQAQAECQSQIDYGYMAVMWDSTDLQQIIDAFHNLFLGSISGPAEILLGLNRQFWRWHYWIQLSWSNWSPHPSNSDPTCVRAHYNGTWETDDCATARPVVCYTYVKVRIPVPEPEKTQRTSVKVRLSPGSADLNDPVVQQSILNQMAVRLREAGLGVKLTWSQCNKDTSKTAPPTDCNMSVH